MKKTLKKQQLTFALIACASSMILGAFAIGYNGKVSMERSKGTAEEYVLTLNNNQCLDFSSGEELPNYEYVGTTTTTNGNTLKFACKNYYKFWMGPSSSYWMYFNNGGFTAGYEGYFYNYTPITGMKTISLESNSLNNEVKLQWSGDTIFNESDSTVLSFENVGGKAIATYVFDEVSPNYIKVSNAHPELKGMGLKNTVITYSCVNSYASVSTMTNDEGMGSVTGSGTYRLGSDVTLIATPNEGYSFNGWYDGLTRVSRETTYVISNLSQDVSLNAVFQEKVPEVFGSTFNFGYYPQTKVTNNLLVAELNELSGAAPTSEDFGKWQSLGYRLPGDGLEYFWYQDINHSDGYKYRGIYFTSYRSEQNVRTSSTSSTSQDNHYYNLNTSYWFKFEPIQWKVLSVEVDNVLLVSKIILDAQSFSYTSISGRTNEYYNSDMRHFLVNDFTSLAFSAYERNAVKEATVSNAKETSGEAKDDRDTFERVFLLSWADVTNASYGFTDNASRQLRSTDYAKSQGLVSNGYSEYDWWTRSPSNASSNACYINRIGEVTGYTASYLYGVVPAIRILL